MNWLVKKLKVKVPFDENKLYASEILSILLQNEPENRRMFGELNAIDNLLQQVESTVQALLFNDNRCYLSAGLLQETRSQCQ